MTDEEAVRSAWPDATEWPVITTKGNGVEVTDKADYDDMEDALILGEGATSAEAWAAADAQRMYEALKEILLDVCGKPDGHCGTPLHDKCHTAIAAHEETK